MHVGPPILLIALSLFTQVVGLKLGSILLIAFPFLALFSAKSQLYYWLTAPSSKQHWWYAHMSGMVTACIATVTAFLVTALPRIWDSPLAHSPVLWVAPGVIGGVLLRKWTIRYRAQHGNA